MRTWGSKSICMDVSAGAASPRLVRVGGANTVTFLARWPAQPPYGLSSTLRACLGSLCLAGTLWRRDGWLWKHPSGKWSTIAHGSAHTVVRGPRSTTLGCRIFVDRDWSGTGQGVLQARIRHGFGCAYRPRDIGLLQPSSVAQLSFVFMPHSLSVTAIHLP